MPSNILYLCRVYTAVNQKALNKTLSTDLVYINKTPSDHWSTFRYKKLINPRHSDVHVCVCVGDFQSCPDNHCGDDYTLCTELIVVLADFLLLHKLPNIVSFSTLPKLFLASSVDLISVNWKTSNVTFCRILKSYEQCKLHDVLSWT